MGTRSSIAIIKEDGSVSQAYCHWDGYVSHNGVILFSFYQNIDKIKKLISLGDMSVLRSEVDPSGNHTFDNPQENVTVFYGRDRGESNTKAQQFKNVKEYLEKGNFQGYDYVYKEKSNKWYLLDRREHKLKALKGLIKQELSSVHPKYKAAFLSVLDLQKLERKLSSTLTKTNQIKNKI